MPKGYWIVQVRVRDAENFPTYVEATRKALEKYGAKYLVRSTEGQVREGEMRPLNVAVEFESYARAVACYESEDYAPALAMRKQFADSDLLIVEGTE
jgi:uncharacterized protein (DUF1330 family)